MPHGRIDSDTDLTLYAAEQAGLKLAIKGRLIALFFVGVYLLSTRGAERAPEIVASLAGLALLGLIHFAIIGTAWDRKWVKYAFMSTDLMLLSVAVAILPPEPVLQVPQIMMFRFDVFLYYFVVLAVAAFSFSPGLVLWSGALGAAGWLAAFGWVRAGVDSPLEWGDALSDGTSQRFLDVFLDASFVGSGTRFQEALIYIVVACLIAAVMYRARQTVRRRIQAERDMATVSQIFGRFVPAAVAASMIEDRGVLDPVERQATVLFADIAGFTNLTESKGPRATVDVLNAYFDAATEIISKQHGVVTQFQGDAILAVFNVPVENAEHARCAYEAALELLSTIQAGTFGGERLKVRVGLNTGPLIAGNVGGGGRQSYTVHGDAVNLAARLEALNKEHGTSLLVSQSTASLLPDTDLRKIGEVGIKGLSHPVGVYTTAASPPSDPSRQ